MKTIDNLLALVGVTAGRRAPAPTYRAITDGLIITSTRAVAWFEIPAANTDTMTEAELDAEIDGVVNVAGSVLKDQDCHLKIVWSAIAGADYAASVEGHYRTGAFPEWVAMRAESIDELAMPQRHVLLGVTIAENQRHDTTQAERAAAAFFDIDQHRLKDTDLRRYAGIARKLGRELRASRLHANVASAELLAWSISRDQHRDATAVPRHGHIVGAQLATLTRGRVEPFPDHVRIYDTRGDVVAYTAVLPVTDFPESMQTPGEGEWLRTISEVTRINDSATEWAGAEEPVIIDASVRFRVVSRGESLKLAQTTLDLAKEQKRSAAKSSAGYVDDDTEDSEFVSGRLISDIKRDGLVLVRSHPRFVVSAATRDDLDSSVTAVVSHFAELGITVSRGADEQRELWLETLPGDQLRIDDLGHIMDGHGFFGSLFWGGSALTETAGPVIGQIVGTTPGLLRFDITAFSKRDQSTTVGVIGRSGMGKTTAMELLTLDAGMAGAWCMLTDFKGDTSGLVTAARELGIPSGLIQITGANSGALDLFAALPIEDAPAQVARQLSLVAPTDLASSAPRLTLAAANIVAGTAAPSTWAVLEHLAASADTQARMLGEALKDTAQTQLGRVLMGAQTGESVLTTEPGIWVLQLPGLVLPSQSVSEDRWDPVQRVSLAAMRAITTHALFMSSNNRLRGLPKVIAVPEVHRMLKTSDGRDFLDQIARMGRAYGTALMLDTQDAQGIASHEGLVEQLAAVLGFQLQSPPEQDALAQLLGMLPGEEARTMIGALGVTSAGGVEKGHCLVHVGTELAQGRIDLPNEWITDLLDTNPERTSRTKETEPAA
jgi:hypothetical protein